MGLPIGWKRDRVGIERYGVYIEGAIMGVVKFVNGVQTWGKVCDVCGEKAEYECIVCGSDICEGCKCTGEVGGEEGVEICTDCVKKHE